MSSGGSQINLTSTLCPKTSLPRTLHPAATKRLRSTPSPSRLLKKEIVDATPFWLGRDQEVTVF